MASLRATPPWSAPMVTEVEVASPVVVAGADSAVVVIVVCSMNWKMVGTESWRISRVAS